MCLISESDSMDFSAWHEAGHLRPAFDHVVLDNGNEDGFSHGGVKAILEPLIISRLLPYVRKKYNYPQLELASAILRRSRPGQELSHAVPQDTAAYVTVVVGLSREQDFEGGLFVQDAPDVGSRAFVSLAAGDAIAYRYDLAHGIQVLSGCWYNAVFWFRGLHARTSPWLFSDAKGGDSDAQAKLGQSFYEGSFCNAQDYSLAYPWLRLAAEQGHPEAQCLLGTMYRDGNGGPPTPEFAAEWWRRAASQGHARSQALLGALLLRPGGAPGGAGEALSWLRAAADQGDCDALFDLFGIYGEGRHGCPKDAGRAEACVRAAAEGGHFEAQCSLAFALLSRSIENGSPSDALFWAKSAATGGHVEAQLFLANVCRGSPDTRSSVAGWLAQAAKQGDVGAQRELGELLLGAASEGADGSAGVAAVGWAWLRVAAARDGGAAPPFPQVARGAQDHDKAAACIAALFDQPFTWTSDRESPGLRQRFLDDFTEQVVLSQEPLNQVRIGPSWGLVMDFMSVQGSNDPLFRWANNRGTLDYPRAVTHDETGVHAVDRTAVVACDGWDAAAPSGKRLMADEAFAKLSSQGYVVLERLLPRELVRPLEAEFERLLGKECLSSERLRGGRREYALPFEDPWDEDLLLGHELVMELVSRYVCNNSAATRTGREDQLWAFLEWAASGAGTDYYTAKPGPQQASPSFGAIDVIHTPPGTMPQLRHRDTNLPGICASLTVNVPLTPLTPDNGPIGFVPGSHLRGEEASPKLEVLACPPPGSVILYDSFTEHRGCENTAARPRSVLSLTFDPGVWMRSFNPAGAGPAAWGHFQAFRRKIGGRLRRLQSAARREAPWPDPAARGRRCAAGHCAAGLACRGGDGAEALQPLVEDQRTAKWYCEACWSHDWTAAPPAHEAGDGRMGLRPYEGLAGPEFR